MVPWLSLLPLALAAQSPLPRTYPAASDVSMRIWVPVGKIHVDTWDRDSIRVSGRAGHGAHFYGGSFQHSAKFGVEMDDRADTSLASGELTVTVPRKAHVLIKMTDGEATAINTAGVLEVVTVAGSISVRAAQGTVSVRGDRAHCDDADGDHR